MMAEGVQEEEGRVEPIFDFLAQTVGWLEGEIAFGNDGRPVAFIHEGAVFAAKDGHHLGHFHEGVFRDCLGCIVAFVRGSTLYTALTTPQDARVPPNVQSRAVPGRAHLPAEPTRRANPLLKTSSLDWEGFVTGCEAQRPWKTRR